MPVIGRIVLTPPTRINSIGVLFVFLITLRVILPPKLNCFTGVKHRIDRKPPKCFFLYPFTFKLRGTICRWLTNNDTDIDLAGSVIFPNSSYYGHDGCLDLTPIND